MKKVVYLVLIVFAVNSIFAVELGVFAEVSGENSLVSYQLSTGTATPTAGEVDITSIFDLYRTYQLPDGSWSAQELIFTVENTVGAEKLDTFWQPNGVWVNGTKMVKYYGVWTGLLYSQTGMPDEVTLYGESEVISVTRTNDDTENGDNSPE